MTPKRKFLLALALSIVATLGVLGYQALRMAQIKNAILIDSHKDHARCIERSEPLADDAVTPHGTVADLLRVADSGYTTPLFWNAKRDVAEHAAMDTRSRLHLTLSRRGPARLVHSTAYYPKGVATAALLCSDRVEVDVQAKAVTDDNVLNESFGPRLTFREDGSIGFSAPLPLESLGGSFAITETHRDGLAADHLELNFRFPAQGKVEGYIGGAYPVSDDSGTFTTLVRFACLPEQACP